MSKAIGPRVGCYDSACTAVSHDADQFCDAYGRQTSRTRSAQCIAHTVSHALFTVSSWRLMTLIDYQQLASFTLPYQWFQRDFRLQYLHKSRNEDYIIFRPCRSLHIFHRIHCSTDFRIRTTGCNR